MEATDAAGAASAKMSPAAIETGLSVQLTIEGGMTSNAKNIAGLCCVCKCA